MDSLFPGSTSSKDPSSGSSNSRQRTSAGGVQPAPVDRAGYAKSSSSSSVGGRWIVNESDAERRLCECRDRPNEAREA